jgi:hypothetical protein
MKSCRPEEIHGPDDGEGREPDECTGERVEDTDVVAAHLDEDDKTVGSA